MATTPKIKTIMQSAVGLRGVGLSMPAASVQEHLQLVQQPLPRGALLFSPQEHSQSGDVHVHCAHLQPLLLADKQPLESQLFYCASRQLHPPPPLMQSHPSRSMD